MRPSIKLLAKPTAVEWACLAIGLFLVLHYAWLMDDAYIYFRYVDNALFLDYGLAYNAGEYVEGFSSPLWTLLLLGLRATGLNYWIIVRLIGVLSFAAFWAILVATGRRASPDDAPILDLPLCVLTCTYGVASYFTSGMETPLVLVSAALFAMFAFAPDSRALQAALAVTPLVRHELALPFALCLAFSWSTQKRFPRWMLGAFAATMLPWMVFRITYYADFLPATFYLKNGTDPIQGFTYLWNTFGTYKTAWFLGAAGAALVLLGGSQNLKKRAFAILLGASVAAYVVKIGGDAIHFRYLAFPYVLWIASTAGIAEQVVTNMGWARFPRALWGIPALLGVGTFLLYPPQLDRHPFSRREGNRLLDKINDASLHRHNAGLTPDPWGSGAEREQREAYARFLATKPAVPYRSVITGWWCVSLYEQFDKHVVHGYGLTDAILARVSIEANRPGHKNDLRLLSRDLARIIGRAGKRPGPDMYRRAVATGFAAPWIEENLDTIEAVARKTYNEHDFLENLRLALSFPGRIDPGRLSIE